MSSRPITAKRSHLSGPEREENARKAHLNLTAKSPQILFWNLLTEKLSKEERSVLIADKSNLATLKPEPQIYLYALYWAFNGSFYLRNTIRGFLSEPFLKAFKTAEALSESRKKHLKQLEIQEAEYEAALSAHNEMPQLCKTQDELLERLKQGHHDADPELWHEITEQIIGSSEPLPDLLIWIVSQPNCYRETAAVAFCARHTYALLKYANIDLTRSDAKNFELVKLIATRWARDDFVKSEVGTILLSADQMTSGEKEYDETAANIISSGGALPWDKPDGIFAPIIGRRPNSDFTYSCEFFSDEGGLRPKPPKKPPLMV